MALNSAKELLERTMNDAELRERIMQSEPEGIVALAGELGLDMTVEELSEAMKTAGKPDGSRPKEMGLAELEQVAGGKPYLGEGVIDFFSWVACGFNHHYEYTGETQQRIDFAFKVDFYQQRCRDCGHINWTRTAPPNVQGPKIKKSW